MSGLAAPRSDSFVLANARLLDPAAGIREPKARELLIEKGIVRAVGEKGVFSGKGGGQAPEVFDAQGLLCVPGLVDLHTHLREPGFEYKETIASGTAAAAAGGFTSVLCMANTEPVNDNPYVTRFIIEQARAHGSAKVYPVGALSKGLKGERLAEIGKMRDAGAVAISDDGMPVMNSYLMRKALDYCRAFGIVVISHAEDANLVGQGVMNEGFHSNCLGLRGNPAESEEILVARDIALARLTRGRVHFAHLSTRQALEHVRRAKEEGLAVTCEATPHHLTFTDEDVRGYDANFKMAPPLRSVGHVEALKAALRDGVIDCIATDHAPHAPRDKEVLFEFAANGVVGLETAWPAGLALVEQGCLTLVGLVERLSVNPARIAGVPGGTLKEGAAADFMLTDETEAFELSAESLHSLGRNSPFLGRKLKGRARATFLDGRCRWMP